MSAAMYQPGVVFGDVVSVQLQSSPQKSIDVTINDTGPFARDDKGKAIRPLRPDPNIIIDLTPAAFLSLAGSLKVGVVQVIVTLPCE
jgi:hypothetical protein